MQSLNPGKFLIQISYEIEKAHSRELTAETKQGEYAAFIITLPI